MESVKNVYKYDNIPKPRFSVVKKLIDIIDYFHLKRFVHVHENKSPMDGLAYVSPVTFLGIQSANRHIVCFLFSFVLHRDDCDT